MAAFVRRDGKQPTHVEAKRRKDEDEEVKSTFSYISDATLG